MVLTHAGVKRVLIENNVAVGVEMESGEKIFAPKIVSSAGVHKTFLDLVPQDNAIARKLKTQAQSLPASIGHVCLYVGLKGNADELQLPKANYWIYPHNDFDRALDEFCADPEKELPLTYISFPGAKDPHWRAHHPDASTIEIITFSPWEWFTKWEESKWHKRGQDYDDFKEFLAQKMLEKLYKHSPLTKGRVDYYELSTPLSTKHFCSYKKGEIYGLDHTPARFLADWLTPDTPIKNLYMTGQDIVSVGIGSSAMSGVLTTGKLARMNALGMIMKAPASNNNQAEVQPQH
jgi:all-trans-retinol 13,14-reductase